MKPSDNIEGAARAIFSIPGHFKDDRTTDPNADGDGALGVIKYEGQEGISRLFDYRVTLLEDHDGTPKVDFGQVLNQPAVLTFRDVYNDDPDRHVYGIIAEISVSPDNKEVHQTVYQVRLVPPHYRMTLGRDMRIFPLDQSTAKQSTPDIIETVLEKANLGDGTRLDLAANYPARDFTVQYRESDWNFISRLCEEEGICYYFEHTPNSVTLVFSDDKSKHTHIAKPKDVPYRTGGAGGATALGHVLVSEFGIKKSIGPGKVTLRDYVFSKAEQGPKATENKGEVTVEGRVDLMKPDWSIYDAPGEYQTKAVGERLAQVRMQEHECRHEVGVGRSNCVRLTAGKIFSLGTKSDQSDAKHRIESLNQEYLIVGLRCSGSGQGSIHTDVDNKDYDARFIVIPVGYQFRPERVTPVPRIDGVVTAEVVGPKLGESAKPQAIYTEDEKPGEVGYGRVRVAFHWDRHAWTSDTPKGDASCWIRVAQPQAGLEAGTLHMPRVGDEVAVAFIGGDPDRPVILGSLYNSQQKMHPLIGDDIGFESLDYTGGPKLKKDKRKKYLPDRKHTTASVYCSTNDELGPYTSLESGGVGRWTGSLIDFRADSEQWIMRSQGDWFFEACRNLFTTVAGSMGTHVEGGQATFANEAILVSTEKDHKVFAGTFAAVRAKDQVELAVGGTSVVVKGNSIHLKSDNVTVEGDLTVEGNTHFNGPKCAQGPTKTK